MGSFPVLMGVKLNELSSIDADMLLDKRHKKGVSSSFIKCVTSIAFDVSNNVNFFFICLLSTKLYPSLSLGTNVAQMAFRRFP